MLSNGTAYDGDHTTTDRDHDPASQSKSLTAEDVAKRVFTFVNSANAFAGAMEEGDDVKLLRMRSKKNEVVIVPGEYPYDRSKTKEGKIMAGLDGSGCVQSA